MVPGQLSLSPPCQAGSLPLAQLYSASCKKSLCSGMHGLLASPSLDTIDLVSRVTNLKNSLHNFPLSPPSSCHTVELHCIPILSGLTSPMLLRTSIKNGLLAVIDRASWIWRCYLWTVRLRLWCMRNFRTSPCEHLCASYAPTSYFGVLVWGFSLGEWVHDGAKLCPMLG